MKNKLLLSVLVLSLGLNCLLVGFLLGKKIRPPHPPLDHPSLPRFLTPENRDRFVKTMRNLADGSPLLFGELEKARQEMADALAAPSIDEIRYSENADKLIALNRQLHENISRNIHEFAEHLTPEERIGFAKHLKALPPPFLPPPGPPPPK
jgi:uncharacterized membrane protein